MSDNLIGATTAIFIVSLSIAVAEPVDVAWSTRDGTAKAGTEYQAANGVVSFLPGETTKQIEVIVYGQNVSPTGDKNFFINLMPPTNAVLGATLIEAVIKVEDESGVPVTSVIVAQGKRGLKGDPGLSAYDQAVLMGYEGTVEEWMQEQADAAAAAQRASNYAANAAAAATKAENAATAASFLGNIFPTPEAGVDPVTGVGNGAYYNVRSTDNDSFLIEYQNIGGVPTPSGKSYPSAAAVQVINNELEDLSRNTAYFYPTVAAMLADQSLTDGVIVGTKGYHNIFDDGGAVYLISSTATDYSIPLANGLHAVFRDTFDIRKFGIRDSKTLDQTAELQRMIAYADSRFYEIDFHGFNIRKPNILQIGKGDIPINGMIFNYAHKLKNLKPCNDKTAVLQQDSSCIAFMPKSNPETIEVFELDNVVFDPYVANYNITAGHYDGNMHGFIAHPHIDSTDLIAWGTQKTNFGFRFKDIKSISPAISYNITTAAVFAQFIETDNISGEFIGCYINNHSVRHNFKNTHGVYRDDLHNPSRLLVTSLIHHEPELAGGSISIEGFNLDNISCIKHSDQTNHISFKLHSLGTITINEVKVNNVGGRFEFYAANGNNSKVKDLSVSNSQELAPSLLISIDKTLFDNTPVNDLLFSDVTKRYITCELKDSVVNAGIIYDGCTLDELFLDRATITNPTYGLVRAEAYIKEININDIRVSGGRFVFCKFDQIKGNGLTITDTPTVAGEFLQAIANTAPSAVKITGVKALVSTPGYFINKYAGHVLNADLRFSEFLAMPAFNVDTLHYELNSPPNTYNTPFNPPAIAAGASVTKEITVLGAKVGDPVDAAFTQYNASVSVSADVVAANTVLVTFKNNGASPITISGSINLRI